MGHQFKYMGELTSCTSGYRGFALSYAVIRNAQNQLVKIPCLAIFGNFELKEGAKTFCKERGGAWSPHPQRFWFVPLKSSPNRSWDCVQEALEVASQYCETVEKLYMFASGFGGRIAQQLEKDCAAFGAEDEDDSWLTEDLEKDWEIADRTLS